MAPTSPLSVRFRLRRCGVVLGLLVGYAWYYVCRYSLNYAAPSLAMEEGLDKSRIGLLTSLGQISVGCSKMGGSVLTADLSPTKCLMLGLLLTGLFNIFAASMPDFPGERAMLVAVLGAIWAGNGIWQGFGSPACARVLDAWCRPEERGTFWSIWNTSNNLGGALAPILVGVGVAYNGWRGGLSLAGFSAFAMAGMVMLLVRDSPIAAGLEDIRGASKADAKQASASPKEATSEAGVAAVAAVVAPLSSAAAGSGNIEGLKGWQLFWWGCFNQQGVGRLAIANFLIYAIRASFISWFAFYILDGGRLGQAVAASLLSAFEVGGLFGSLVSGVLSDNRTKQQPGGPIVGLRVETALLAVASLLLPSVIALCLVPPSSGPITFVPVLFCAGFGLYVAQSLTALCGLELVPRRAVGVSQGFLGLAAYTGAASAGLPLGYLIQGPMHWRAWHVALVSGCVGLMVALLPLRRLQSYGQREAEAHGLPPTSVTPLRANEWPRARRVARLAATPRKWLRRRRGEGTSWGADM